MGVKIIRDKDLKDYFSSPVFNILKPWPETTEKFSISWFFTVDFLDSSTKSWGIFCSVQVLMSVLLPAKLLLCCQRDVHWSIWHEIKNTAAVKGQWRRKTNCMPITFGWIGCWMNSLITWKYSSFNCKFLHYTKLHEKTEEITHTMKLKRI